MTTYTHILDLAKEPEPPADGILSKTIYQTDQIRAFLVWLVIIATEMVHGILRGVLLVPIVGDLSARQIGVLIGSLLIFGVAYLFIRWMAVGTTLRLVVVGLLWVVLTVLFQNPTEDEDRSFTDPWFVFRGFDRRSWGRASAPSSTEAGFRRRSPLRDGNALALAAPCPGSGADVMGEFHRSSCSPSCGLKTASTL